MSSILPPQTGGVHLPPPSLDTNGAEGAARTQGPLAMSIADAAGLQDAAAKLLGGAGTDPRSLLNLLPEPLSQQQSTEHVLQQLGSLDSATLGVDIYAIMAEFQKSAQEMRNANREIRASELNAQVSSLMSAADEMKKAADFRLAAGIVQGATQIVSGALQAGMSSAAAAKTIQGAKLDTQATNAGNLSKRVSDLGLKDELREMSAGFTEAGKIATARGTELQGQSSAVGGIATGLGGIASAALNHAAESADVTAKRLEAEAKLHETASQQASDMMQQMMDVIRDVRDKLQSIEQSRLETTRGIARNI